MPRALDPPPYGGKGALMLRALAEGLFGEQYGSGPARILALPGWMRSRNDFREVLAGEDALALDLPGFGGASPPPERAVGAAGYAGLVAPALDVCADRVVVLGHSFGGRVAVNLAAEWPERVAALVLTGVPRLVAPERVPSPSAGYRLVRWLHRHGVVSDGRMETLRRRRGSDDYRNATGVMRDVLVIAVNEHYEAVLPLVTCPVELVWGDDDTAAPVAGAERAVSRFGAGATLTIVPGAGHLTPLTAAPTLRAALDRHR
jgi:pimeloyl-ACP methyl ester carboxylesterase